MKISMDDKRIPETIYLADSIPQQIVAQKKLHRVLLVIFGFMSLLGAIGLIVSIFNTHTLLRWSSVIMLFFFVTLSVDTGKRWQSLDTDTGQNSLVTVHYLPIDISLEHLLLRYLEKDKVTKMKRQSLWLTLSSVLCILTLFLTFRLMVDQSFWFLWLVFLLVTVVSIFAYISDRLWLKRYKDIHQHPLYTLCVQNIHNIERIYESLYIRGLRHSLLRKFPWNNGHEMSFSERKKLLQSLRNKGWFMCKSVLSIYEKDHKKPYILTLPTLVVPLFLRYLEPLSDDITWGT